jgi:GNAT superfamily N-acetyltransferase
VALPELRQARPEDVPAILEVFFRAVDDLDERRGRALRPRNRRSLEAHLGHLLATDASSSVVAAEGHRVVAFGVLMSRDRDAFLSFLFVLPEWQGRGLGRTVLDECRRGAGRLLRLSTCAEADQLVSTGLYASLGMAPREPLYLLRGALDAGSLPALPDHHWARPLESADTTVIDDVLLGYRRPQDHAFWASGERRGWAFGSGGTLVGYGYAHPSGHIGPVAALDAHDLPALLGHLARATDVLEGRQVIVGGVAASTLVALLAAGMRLDGTPAIYCADRPGPAFDRYVPMSFALL